jgi:hypothetical protein
MASTSKTLRKTHNLLRIRMLPRFPGHRGRGVTRGRAGRLRRSPDPRSWKRKLRATHTIGDPVCALTHTTPKMLPLRELSSFQVKLFLRRGDTRRVVRCTWDAVTDVTVVMSGCAGGRSTIDALGRYASRTIKPVSYPIPSDGPVAKRVLKTRRHP